MKDNTIFVQVASYRDPQLIPTLDNMIENSVHPENLRVTVNWQHGDEQSIDDFLDAGYDVKGYSEYSFMDIDDKDKTFNVIELTKGEAAVNLIDVQYTETKGTCWARHLIQQQYNKEKYTLQLDSHHRFVESWDEELIQILEGLRKDSPKPVLTGYIPSFNPENDPAGRVKVPWKTNFDRFIPEGAVFFIPSTIDDKKELDKPLKARFYSGHFCFADGSFAEDVQHDPEYFFHGEEISIAVRAFTHGYDLYTPHKVLIWHEYTRKGRTKVWDDHTTINKKKGDVEKDWVERNNMCHKRNRILFGMDGEDPNQIDFGKYGFGTERTLREYEEYAGISFEYRGVQQPTLDKTEPPVNYPYKTEEEWKNSFARSNDIRVCVHKNEFPKAFDSNKKLLDDIDFVFVGAHDGSDQEIHRKDLSASEFKKYMTSGNEWVDYRFIFLSTDVPRSYTIWPHSGSKGWLDKVTKPVDG